MIIEDTSQEKSLIHQEHGYFSAMLSEYGETQNFKEAWHTEDPEKREVWHTSIPNEFKYMINKGVWRKPERRNVPTNRRLIDSKWLFQKKRDS